MQTYKMFVIQLLFHLWVFLADRRFDNGHYDLSQIFYVAFPEYGLILNFFLSTFWS